MKETTANQLKSGDRFRIGTERVLIVKDVRYSSRRVYVDIASPVTGRLVDLLILNRDQKVFLVNQ
jgi:hypothetical protein